MKIQQLNKGNAALLGNVANNVFDNPIDTECLNAFLSCPRHHLLVAVENTLVIGMVSAVEYFHPDKLPQLWINELAVTPNRQSQGIGRALVAELLAIARERGCVSAWVGTENSNLAANRCYGSIDNGQPPQQFVMHEWKLAE